MDLKKNYRINSLFEFYGSLLTSKQKNYIQLYYVDDYSLGEISENFHVSRQAVYDNIKRTELILERYEKQLHLYKEFVIRNRQFDQIKDYVEHHYADDQKLHNLLDHLEHTEEE
ncbi:UPF0122 protein [Philodulcilactobacillus myokoensis]|uniref:UPF0122 protein WR164_08030 n=1 Tax=Philodulcilactobacillus myokoensis TaxID=2929573 RepID=A0A9W6ET68_9LACO|nr:putative DNA-binding protein [Philodulcilactobacillus myokoensis]GLB46824.1 UPF0122 protein [Philodulcilactobacillus myokoensis]